MMTHRKRMLPALLALFLPLPLVGQQPGAAPVLDSDALEVSIGGRIQTQLNTTTVDDEPPSELLIRRARLEIGIQVNEFVSATLQPEFAGDRVSLRDAYVDVGFSPAAHLQVGNLKRPFGIFDLISSKRMPVIERGLRIRGVSAADEYVLTSGLDYGERDVGAMLVGAPTGAPLGMSYAAGIFRGPLHGEVGAQDSYQWAGRIAVAPLPSLQVGAAWSSRHFTDGIGDLPALERGHAFEVDVEHGAFAPGLHVIAQLSAGDLDPGAGTRFVGAQGWLGYRTGRIGERLLALEPVLRVSHARVDDGAPVAGGTLVTPGINLYLTPLTRAMLNYDVWRGESGAQDAQSLKLMVQVAF